MPLVTREALFCSRWEQVQRSQTRVNQRGMRKGEREQGGGEIDKRRGRRRRREEQGQGGKRLKMTLKLWAGEIAQWLNA